MDLDSETIRLLQQEFQEDFSPAKTLSDSLLARQLQEQFANETIQSPRNNFVTSDSELAKRLQEQFEREISVEKPTNNLVYSSRKKNRDDTKSLVDPSWEVIDPTPDIHVLFIAFNNKFFWGKLDSVCVSWSKKMKRCAGVCSYQGAGGMCHITLSEPLLKLRPRKDLVETLLHEMIHALLFVTHNNKDRDGHGPEFHKHMYRINGEAGTNITVYHDFHDEVKLYQQHWWRCDGPCQKWKPYFGIVRRSMNRAPGPSDRWFGEHSRSCGGTFTKIKSPEPVVKEVKKGKENTPLNDIRKFLPPVQKPGTSGLTSTSKISNPNSSSSTKSITNINTISKPQSGLTTAVTISSKTNNIHGFTNSGNKSNVIQKGATKNSSNTIVINPKTKSISNTKPNETKTVVPSSSFVPSANETPINYDIVRNHWLNKFSQSGSDTNSANKRKSLGSVPKNSKSPKLELPSSQDYSNFNSAPCPVCEKYIPIDELNEHLDNCLNTPLSTRKEKECVICSKMIGVDDYDRHIDQCLSMSFNDDSEDDVFIVEDKNKSVVLIEEDSMDVNRIQCDICENTVLLDDLEEHLKICSNRSECPECMKKINPETYDVHLADCLLKKFDAVEKNETIKTEESEMVECLACGKKIVREILNSHLDECLNTMFKDEMSQKNVENDDVMCNCPFCLKLILETEMSQHINICLKITDEDSEIEKNKSMFLDEMD